MHKTMAKPRQKQAQISKHGCSKKDSSQDRVRSQIVPQPKTFSSPQNHNRKKGDNKNRTVPKLFKYPCPSMIQKHQTDPRFPKQKKKKKGARRLLSRSFASRVLVSCRDAELPHPDLVYGRRSPLFGGGYHSLFWW